ncbi:MAG: Mur ligase family protein, partial [Candidatus Zixiibacteriota bacterium]
MTAEERIKNRKIGIVGMARSGMAAASLALEWGGQPFVSDCASASKLARETAQLKRKGIPFETDRHSERLLACDYLVASPGVPPDIEILRKAREKGIPIFSELEFAFWACRGKVIAVTGSNGKTTTTTLIGEIFKAAGYESSVCGNIGLPLSEVVSKTNENSVTVVEVSTFQLEAIADFKPYVAVILNLSPDHLDRHGSFEGYKALKYRITENQTAEDFLVLNKDDVETMNDVANGVIAAEAKKVFFTTTDTTGVSTYVKDGFLYTSWGGTESKVIHCHD